MPAIPEQYGYQIIWLEAMAPGDTASDLRNDGKLAAHNVQARILEKQ